MLQSILGKNSVLLFATIDVMDVFSFFSFFLSFFLLVLFLLLGGLYLKVIIGGEAMQKPFWNMSSCPQKHLGKVVLVR